VLLVAIPVLFLVKLHLFLLQEVAAVVHIQPLLGFLAALVVEVMVVL
jgi:hypothetical protein